MWRPKGLHLDVVGACMSWLNADTINTLLCNWGNADTRGHQTSDSDPETRQSNKQGSHNRILPRFNELLSVLLQLRRLGQHGPAQMTAVRDQVSRQQVLLNCKHRIICACGHTKVTSLSPLTLYSGSSTCRHADKPCKAFIATAPIGSLLTCYSRIRLQTRPSAQRRRAPAPPTARRRGAPCRKPRSCALFERRDVAGRSPELEGSVHANSLRISEVAKVLCCPLFVRVTAGERFRRASVVLVPAEPGLSPRVGGAPNIDPKTRVPRQGGGNMVAASRLGISVQLEARSRQWGPDAPPPRAPRCLNLRAPTGWATAAAREEASRRAAARLRLACSAGWAGAGAGLGLG